MVNRGVKCDIVRGIDVHPCWRWTFFVDNRRQAGQTKISLRAAEIQVRKAVDKALGPGRAGHELEHPSGRFIGAYRTREADQTERVRTESPSPR
jgi:hypothetical protein